MSHPIPRTFSEVVEDNPLPRTLEDLRARDAYVLLGGPGMGKTTTFIQEAEEEGGCYVTARNFIALRSRREWREATLFIDGLDEMRAGKSDKREPFDKIRAKLERLGIPRFRLSCRTADWLGDNDLQHLTAVSPKGRVSIFRLDPLSQDAVREYLEHQENIDAGHFLDVARRRKIEFMLAHPQSLQMLVELAADGIESKTRTELFDNFIRKLLEEHNEEHDNAHRAIGREILMDAAGELCAIQLLSGLGGYASTGRGSDDCPKLDHVPAEDQEVLGRVLSTRLFARENGCATPVHAQMAEFAAAKYLAKRIAEGLPAGRVLALMTDENGAIMPELRGLSAWLAAHSESARRELIARDPSGAVLYGDARNFSCDEKSQILERLKLVAEEQPWPKILDHIDPKLGDLATDDMEERFREHLENLALVDPEDIAERSFALILLETIKNGPIRRRLAASMLNIVKDGRWPPTIRERALDDYIENDGTETSDLLPLLRDMEKDPNLDPTDSLTAQLLEALYPDALSAMEVLRYLRRLRMQDLVGGYVLFWEKLIDHANPHQLAELLDAFAAQYKRLCNEALADSPPDFFLIEIPQKLLSRFLLTAPPKTVELKRLFSWLRLAAWHGEHEHEHELGNQDAAIVAWLERRPEDYKTLIKMGWEHCAARPERVGAEEFGHCLFLLERCFCRAMLPKDFGRWCLDQAVAIDNPIIREYLGRQIANFVHWEQHDKDLSMEIVQKRASGHFDLLRSFQEQLSQLKENARLSEETDRRITDIREKDAALARKRRLKRHAEIKQHEAALKENRCPPRLLGFLARAYYGEFGDIRGPDPRSRLRHLLNDDAELVDAALSGLRETMGRDDLPDATEIIRLTAEHKIHFLAKPFLISFGEAMRQQPETGPPVKEEHLRLALAIHYTVPIRWVGHKPPEWYEELLKTHPRTVAEVLVKSVRSELRSKRDCRSILDHWFSSSNHAEIARSAALPLLRSFSPRAAGNLLPSLKRLLAAALSWSPKDAFLRLAERKLSSPHMTVAQRACWLTASFLVAPDAYRKELESYASENSSRMRHLVEFIADTPQYLTARAEAGSLFFLIQLLAPSCKHLFDDADDSEMGVWRTSSTQAGMHIQSWIERLAIDPSEEATQALETLVADENLHAWTSLLRDALYRQKELRQVTDFDRPTIDQVIKTLRNDRPANAADLAALTLDILEEIARKIRDGSPAEWRQYWNLDPSNRKPLRPRHEDDCRDTLLSRLKDSLQRLGIDAQPEAHYADDKRPDISVSYGEFKVPVEIKKSSNPELWTAIEEQLVGEYARHPGADGYGIYLVFWLGKEQECRLPPSGVRPENRMELQRQLQGTLTREQSRKISICVVDIEKAP